MAEQSLKEKTIKGTFWSAADSFLGHGVTFAVGIVLARLLSPTEYGLIGICLIFTSVLSSIVDGGFSSAVIRKKDANNNDYNTMFFTNLLVSMVMFVFLYVSAPLISLFFKRPELTALTRVMSLLLIFQALSITQVTILTKRIDFKTKAKASLVAAVISGIVGISMAFGGCGVWALVGQKLSNTLLYSLCLWILNSWRPNGVFNRDSFFYMWGFGWKIMLSGLLNNIWNQLYQVVVGKCYSPATLGQYSRSKEYANIFSANFAGIIQRVSYPVLSGLQDDKPRMITAYRKIIKITMFVTMICMIPLGAISEPLLFCLIGPQWQEAASYMPLICLSLSLYPLHAINLNMLQVQGRSDIYLYLEIAKKLISVIPLSLGIFVGIYWMLIGSIATGIISFFLNSYYTGCSLHYSSWMQIKDIAPSFGISLFVSFPIYFFKFLTISPWCILSIQLVCGTILLLIVCQLLKIDEFFQLKNIIVSYVAKQRKNERQKNKKI